MEAAAEPALSSWIPAMIRKRGGQALVEWLFTGQEAYSEPFFDETIAHCRKHERNNRIRIPSSTLDFISSAAESTDGISPSAFIFHVSRCGSTMLTQLLAQSERHIVLSEVPFFEQILREPGLNETQRAQLLRSAIALYGQRRSGKEERLFIKLDAWHVYEAELFRKLFPRTPFIFLYREPAAVIRSHGRQRGMHMIPGLVQHPLPEETLSATDLDAYAAQVLRCYYEAGLSLCNAGAHAVNYSEGLMEGLLRVCARIGIRFDEKLLQRMQERGRSHSKHPGQVFSEAPVEMLPQNEFFPAAQNACAQLEALRNRQIAVPA